MTRETTLRRELSRVKRMLSEAREDHREADVLGLYGALQTLEWALDHNAASPSVAFRPVRRVEEVGP